MNKKTRALLAISNILIVFLFANQVVYAEEDFVPLENTHLENENKNVKIENTDEIAEEILEIDNQERDNIKNSESIKGSLNIDQKRPIEVASELIIPKVNIVEYGSQEHFDDVQQGENLELKSEDTNVLKFSNYERAISTQYQMKLAHGNYSIDTLPYGVKNFETVGKVSDYVGETIQVINESSDGYYAEIQLENGTYLGWVDKRSFDYEQVKTYESVIMLAQYNIDTKPWGEEGYQTIEKTQNYVGQTVKVVAENSDGTYKLTVFSGKELGWIDHRALARSDATTLARIGRGGYSVDTQPWGSTNYQTIDQTDNLLGRQVQVVRQNQNADYSYVLVNKYYFWVDNRALIIDKQVTESWLIHPNYRIDNVPWGERGFKKRGTTSDYVNQRVQILGTNRENTYYLIADTNNEPLGWVDYRSLSNVNYQGQIIRGARYSIGTRPWGTAEHKRVGWAKDYLYENIKIVGVTRDKNYVFALYNDRVLGWIDNRALSNINYQAQVISGGKYSIDSRPWGVSGYKRVGWTKDYLYENVQIVGISSDNNYLLALHNDQVLGWIDYHALSSRQGKIRKIFKTGYSIDSRPWGVSGSKKHTNSIKLLNQQVEVVGNDEAGLYSLIRYGNKQLGWVDNRAFIRPNIINVGNWRLENGKLQTGRHNYYVGNTFIAIDIANQQMWGVRNNKIIVDTPVITGKPGSDTPKGHFKIQPTKKSPTVLVGPGYRAPVQYWIPFIKDMWGIHDSNWQQHGYGGQLYRIGYGSKGCVNTPLGAVRILYNNFSIGSNVVVF